MNIPSSVVDIPSSVVIVGDVNESTDDSSTDSDLASSKPPMTISTPTVPDHDYVKRQAPLPPQMENPIEMKTIDTDAKTTTISSTPPSGKEAARPHDIPLEKLYRDEKMRDVDSDVEVVQSPIEISPVVLDRLDLGR